MVGLIRLCRADWHAIDLRIRIRPGNPWRINPPFRTLYGRLRPRVVVAVSPMLRMTVPGASSHCTSDWHRGRKSGLPRHEKTQVPLEHAAWIGKLETGDWRQRAERRKSNRRWVLPRMSVACPLAEIQCNGRHVQRFGLTIATTNLPASPHGRQGHSKDRESGWQMDCFKG